MNNNYEQMLTELLDIEEKNDIFNLTRHKRACFQEYVKNNNNVDYEELLDKYKRLEEDFMQLVMQSPEICSYCKNHIECKGKECPKYVEGRGCWDDKRCHHDWVWSCQDFDFGTCDMLENTPCNGCIKNNSKGFEWRGSDD